MSCGMAGGRSPDVGRDSKDHLPVVGTRGRAFTLRDGVARGGLGYVRASMKSEDKEFSWWMERSPGQLRLAVAGDLDLAARGVLQDAVIDLLRKYLPSGDSVVLD